MRQTRPPWPPSVLIDLAAGRKPSADTEVTHSVVDIALDHRMGGLLWSWARDKHVDHSVKARLAMADLQVQAHLVKVWALLETCVARLADSGIDVAALKGPTAERRWYARAGERPSSDVDLWLPPHQLRRASDAVRLLQPEHPWASFVSELAVDGRVQTVTLTVEGLQVDLHFDPLKTMLPARQAAEIWESTQDFPLASGLRTRVLDSASATLLFLVHLNKDRFQRLIGYADVARVTAGGVDWDRVESLARGEGIATAVSCSLDAVWSDLRVDPLTEAYGPRSHGLDRRDPKAMLWNMLWRPRIRLRGSDGRRRFRRRQTVIALLADRPSGEKAQAVQRKYLPPRQIRG